MTLKGHSNNIMFSSVSIFIMVQDKHRKLYLGNSPWFGQPPKPIGFGPDQTMVIRLISLNEQIIKRADILKTVPDRHI